MEIDERSEPVAEIEPDGELAQAKARAEELYSELQYARAEVENMRKRAERIADERYTGGRKAMLGKFLPVLDNLRRAADYEHSEGLHEGLNATLKGFEALLAGEGVRPIELAGKPFDPRLAEAIATRDVPDVDDDVVLEEVRQGYLLGDDVLRPALVVVAKHTDG
jgi:molecular chaperone GrpE